MSDEQPTRSLLLQLIRTLSITRAELVALEHLLAEAGVVSSDKLKENREKFLSRIQTALDSLDSASVEKQLQVLLKFEGPIN